MATSVISKRGQIVIPASARKRWGLKGGTVVSFIDTEGGLLIQSYEDTVKRGHGLLAGGSDLVGAFLKEKEEEKKR